MCSICGKWRVDDISAGDGAFSPTRRRVSFRPPLERVETHSTSLAYSVCAVHSASTTLVVAIQLD